MAVLLHMTVWVTMALLQTAFFFYFFLWKTGFFVKLGRPPWASTSVFPRSCDLLNFSILHSYEPMFLAKVTIPIISHNCIFLICFLWSIFLNLLVILSFSKTSGMNQWSFADPSSLHADKGNVPELERYLPLVRRWEKHIEGCTAGGVWKGLMLFTRRNSNLKDLRESCIALLFYCGKLMNVTETLPKNLLGANCPFIALWLVHSSHSTWGKGAHPIIPGLLDSWAQDLTLPLLA